MIPFFAKTVLIPQGFPSAKISLVISTKTNLLWHSTLLTVFCQNLILALRRLKQVLT
jgi:hypothetical protein